MSWRPNRLVLVLGTATGVGKTWTAAGILRELNGNGARVVARKPVQSFDPADAAASTTDAHVLAEAGGESPEDVCPPHRWYETPLAPPMAAAVLGRPPFSVEDLVGELAFPPGTALGLVETAGGPRSPIAADGDSVDLCTALSPDVVVLVADAGLGAINAVRLSVEVLLTGCAPIVVVLNRWDASDVQRRNREWLRRDGYQVTTSVADLAATITHRRL
ncbi:MAG: dethiobiotin synthetase [Actinomycetota bacterium]|nr:dethiobiotin synthetase [Actinomycetota bacterium]